jgi:hypothetical protein
VRTLGIGITTAWSLDRLGGLGRLTCSFKLGVNPLAKGSTDHPNYAGDCQRRPQTSPHHPPISTLLPCEPGGLLRARGVTQEFQHLELSFAVPFPALAKQPLALAK